MDKFYTHKPKEIMQEFGTTESGLTLSHVTDFENELKNAGVETDMVSPKLLPDYRRTK